MHFNKHAQWFTEHIYSDVDKPFQDYNFLYDILLNFGACVYISRFFCHCKVKTKWNLKSSSQIFEIWTFMGVKMAVRHFVTQVLRHFWVWKSGLQFVKKWFICPKTKKRRKTWKPSQPLADSGDKTSSFWRFLRRHLQKKVYPK